MGKYQCPLCGCTEMVEFDDGCIERADCPDCSFGFARPLHDRDLPVPFNASHWNDDDAPYTITPEGRAALRLDAE